MRTFIQFLRTLIIRTIILSLTTFLFVATLSRVHDYSQTRQAIADYHSGDYPLWTIIFYLFNEAGSGVKFALTGDQKHMRYFPRKDNAAGGRYSLRDYELALLGSQQGDWREQLHLSHLIAIGWGTQVDMAEALHWYEESKRVAEENGEGSEWQKHGRRPTVRGLLEEEIRSKELNSLIDSTWIEPDTDDSSILLRASESG